MPVSFVFATVAIILSIFSRKTLPTLVMRAWAKTLMLMYGIRLKVSGSEHVDRNKPAIYMANHASMIDILALIVAFPVDLRFIFKQSLLYLPLVGLSMYLMGMVPVDRAAGPKAAERLNRAGRQIRKGKHILIFPEGTRSHGDALLPFKKGGFYLAIQQGIDIIPVTLNYPRSLCGRDSALAKKGEIEVIIHPRIETEAYQIEDRQQVIKRVRASIESDLKPRG